MLVLYTRFKLFVLLKKSNLSRWRGVGRLHGGGDGPGHGQDPEDSKVHVRRGPRSTHRIRPVVTTVQICRFKGVIGIFLQIDKEKIWQYEVSIICYGLCFITLQVEKKNIVLIEYIL